MIWICGNLERPVIVRQYYHRSHFGLQKLVDDGTLPEADFPLLACRLYTRYTDMDIEATAVFVESWFLSYPALIERLRKGCDPQLGALGQMACLVREATGLSQKPPVTREDSRKIALITSVAGQRFQSSLITFGYTHTRACADSVKILARHIVETENPSVLAVASGIAEDIQGHWTTDLRHGGTDRNCTVLDIDGSYPFEGGQNYVIYSV